MKRPGADTLLVANHFTWPRTHTSNGQTTRSTHGGAARRFLQLVITVTRKLGPSALVKQSGGKTHHVGSLEKHIGKNRSNGTEQLAMRGLGNECFAPAWQMFL